MKYLRHILKYISSDSAIQNRALTLADDQRILEYLLSIGISKKSITEQIEKYYGFPYLDLEQNKLDLYTLKSFSLKNLRSQKVLPVKFNEKSKTYLFVMADFTMAQIKETITYQCQQKGTKAEFFFAFAHEIEKKFEEAELILNKDEEKKQEETLKLAGESSVTEWVERILSRGITLGASDVHIEPQEYNLQVRFRIDGILAVKETFEFSHDYMKSIVIRIKVISGMDISEHRKPQDGSIYGFVSDGHRYDLRVSSIATVFGEKIVLRIFDKADYIATFAELGFSEESEEKINAMLQASYGVVYLAGATGSGKTTTLYSMVQSINSEEINICTIEDPVEKNIKNVNQIHVNSQLQDVYPSTLKALLRQDPDVIVVGEVRDQETAEMCIRASLTGHLVLSTIHANNALDTISRLYNMNIEPYLISAGVLGFLSQRLLRKLCPDCKIKRQTNSHETAWLKHIAKQYNLEEIPNECHVSTGCPACNHIGYKKRTVIVEVVIINDELREMISNRESIKLISDKARENGFVPLELEGYKKVLDGTTSIEEVIRIL